MTLVTVLLIIALLAWGAVLCRGCFVASDSKLEQALWIGAALYTFSSALLVAELGQRAGVL